MSAVSRVAIVGSGVAGTAAAILLAEGGVDVDVFEIKPDLSALGSICAASGRYDFLLSAAPLPITGAVGSPINPVAIL